MSRQVTTFVRHLGTQVFLAIVALGPIATSAEGQKLSPYSEFQAMSVADLATLRVKLSYLPEFQNVGLSAVLFGTALDLLDAELFIPFYRADHAPSDYLGQLKFTVTARELKALIDSVGAVSGVTDGDVDVNGDVSFSLLNTAGDTTKVFEAIVDHANGVPLFNQMLGALSGNPAATRTLRSFGCSVGMLPPTPPASVQSQVRIEASGMKAAPRPAADTFVRVTNTSSKAIPAPIVLVFVHHTDAELLEAEGSTCNIRPPELPFVVLQKSGSLAPGARIDRGFTFRHPSTAKFEVAFRVFAGPGTP